jgi:urease accessory protein UreF
MNHRNAKAIWSGIAILITLTVSVYLWNRSTNSPLSPFKQPQVSGITKLRSSPETVLAGIADLLTTSLSKERLTTFHNALNSASPTDFLEILNMLLNSGGENSPEWGEFWKLWALKYPDEAVEFLQSRRTASWHDAALGIFTEAWAEHDSGAALRFLSSNQDELWFDNIYLRFISGLAGQDPIAATQAFTAHVAKTCDRAYAEKATKLIAEKAAKINGAKGVEAWMQQFPEIRIDERIGKASFRGKEGAVARANLKRIAGDAAVAVLMVRDVDSARGWIEQNVSQTWGDPEWAVSYAEYLGENAPVQRIPWIRSLNLRADLLSSIEERSTPGRVDPFGDPSQIIR